MAAKKNCSLRAQSLTALGPCFYEHDSPSLNGGEEEFFAARTVSHSTRTRLQMWCAKRILECKKKNSLSHSTRNFRITTKLPAQHWAQDWARDWPALALTQVHHKRAVPPACLHALSLRAAATAGPTSRADIPRAGPSQAWPRRRGSPQARLAGRCDGMHGMACRLRPSRIPSLK